MAANLVSGAYILSEGLWVRWSMPMARVPSWRLTMVASGRSRVTISYDTGYWLPPYPMIIFKSELNMLNLKEGKKVWIEKRVK